MGLYGPRFPHEHRLSGSRQYRVGSSVRLYCRVPAFDNAVFGDDNGIDDAEIICPTRGCHWNAFSRSLQPKI